MSYSQKDLGSFSPRFVGASINFHKRDEFLHFLALQGVSWAGNVLDPKDDPDPLRLISAGTVHQHEIRHFHDFSLGTLPMDVFRLKATLLLNALPLLQVVLRSGAEVCPSPILDWIEMSDAERDEIEASAQAWPEYAGKRFWRPSAAIEDELTLSPGINKLNGSVGQSGQYMTYMRNLSRNIRSFQAGALQRKPGSFPISLRYLHEFSALNVQTWAAFDTYGETAASDFFQLACLESPSQISQIFCYALMMTSAQTEKEVRRIWDTWQSGGTLVVDPSAINWGKFGGLVTWAMFGDRIAEGTRGCPVVRFLNVLESAGQSGRPIEGSLDEGDGFFYRFDFDASDYVFTENIARGMQRLELTQERCAEMARLEVDSWQADALKYLNPVLQGLWMSRQQLWDLIGFEPMAYCEPLTYVQNLVDMPQCPLRINLRQADFGYEVHDNPLNNMQPLLATTENGVRTFRDFVIPRTAENQTIPGDDAIRLKSWFDLMTLFFEPQNIDAEENKELQEFVREEYGAKIWFLPFH